MKKITQNLKWLVTLLTMIVSMGAWGQNYEWWETDPSELETGDVVVIVDKTSSKAMTNNNGTSSAPAASSVTLSNERIVSSVDGNIQWEVTVDNGSYQFNVAGTSNYLYYTATNNGVRVGSGEYNVFTIYQDENNNQANFLKGKDSNDADRYIGVYNSADWRCYTSINNNIKNCVTAFYKRVASSTPTPEITITISDENLRNKDVFHNNAAGTLTATVVEDGETVTDPSITWTSSNVSVATVSTNGKVVLVAVGTTTITATYKGHSATYELTVTSSAPDYASLPFEFDDGSSAIAATQGLTQDGLGGDYGSSPKLKFDGTGDYVVLHFNERPGTLSFDIKGNVFSGGTFKVQTSEDGENYTDLKTYSELGSTQSEEFKNLGENVRYIKWIYTEKVSGNVALGNIKLAAYVAPVPYTLTVTPNDKAAISVFYNSDNTEIKSGDEVLAGSEVMVSVSATDGYVVESVSVTDGEGQEVALTEEEEGISWTFTMPSSNVTVSCTVKEFVPAEEFTFVKVTSTADITDGEYLIVYEGASVAFDGSLETLDAEGNTINVNIDNNTITCTDAAAFTIDVTHGTLKSASGKYIGINSNSNGLKQTDAADTYSHTFSIDGDGNAVIAAAFDGSTMSLRYNKASDQTRFRYYKNAGQQAIQLYKKVVEEPVTVTVPGTLAAGKFATRIFPFAPEAIDGVVFYSCAALDGTTLTLMEETELAANTPYILENTMEADIDISQTGVDTHEWDTYTAGLLTGVLRAEPITISGDEYYVLQTQNGKQAFYVANNYSIDVPQYRAYLTYNADGAGQVKALSLGGDDATAINTLEALTSGAYEAIYTVDGKKLSRVEKGVNIVKMTDGTTRKVIVK